MRDRESKTGGQIYSQTKTNYERRMRRKKIKKKSANDAGDQHNGRVLKCK